MKLNQVFKDKEYNKNLFSLAFPLVLQALMLAMVAAADALMLGATDQDNMSAVSLATQFQFLQNMVIFAIIGAARSIGAQYWGKGDKKAVSDVFCISVRINVAISVVVFVGTVFFPELLMKVFTNEPALIEIGVKYLKIAGWSYLMTGISQSYLAHFKITDKAKYSAVISSTTVVLNIILNAVFIFGLLGIPTMGVQGAALATLISRSVELVWAVALSYRKDFETPNLKRLFTNFHQLSKDFFRTVLPLIGAILMWGVGFSSYSSFMGHLGKDAAGANSVAAVVRDLVCSLCDGLSAAGGIIVGNELGKGDLEKGKIYGEKTYIVGFLCGFASMVIIWIVTPILLLFVKLTPEASKLLLGLMLVISIYMIGRAANTIIINGVFTAGGDTNFDAYSLAVTMWCLAVPLAALGTYVFHWNPIVVYAITCLDEVGKIPWVMYHFKKYKWVKDLTR